MEVVIKDGYSLKQGRRALRHSNYRLTVRYGRVYTIKANDGRQPDSKRQLECRDLLMKANVMAKDDIARKGRKKYWERMAQKSGYKTAIGCARAYYIKVLKNKVVAHISCHHFVPHGFYHIHNDDGSYRSFYIDNVSWQICPYKRKLIRLYKQCLV